MSSSGPLYDPVPNLPNPLNRAGHHVPRPQEDGRLAGGLYGLAIGGVFCGESMFSNERDASKFALVSLCALLWKSGFTVLDTQFINPHLLQFGAYEMPQEEYEALIKTEMEKDVTLTSPSESIVQDYLTHRGL